MSIELPLINIPGTKESVKYVTACLEKFVKESQTVTLDDAYLMKLSLNNINNSVNALNSYQEYAINQSNAYRSKSSPVVETVVDVDTNVDNCVDNCTETNCLTPVTKDNSVVEI